MPINGSGADRSLRGDLVNVARYAQETFEREPLLLVGLAAGVGFVLGGGMSRRVLAAVAGLGLRAAADMASNGVLSRTRSARADDDEGGRQ